MPACPKLSEKITLLSFNWNCAYYTGAKPGKKHALNKQYALLSQLPLLTRVYGTLGVKLASFHVTYLQLQLTGEQY